MFFYLTYFFRICKVSGNISSASQSQYEESQNFDAAVLDVESDAESEYEQEDLDLDDDDIPVSFPNALSLNEVHSAY